MIPTEQLGSAGLGHAPARVRSASRPTTIAERFADLLLVRPPAASQEAAVRLLAQGVSAREIYLDVLAPALRVIGTRWQRGIATIAQEHLATAVVGTIMTRLSGQVATSPPVLRRIVLACTDGELHETGLRMVRDFLEGDGWEVFYLGADTPTDGLQRFVDRVQPDAVGLSTALPDRVHLASATIAALRSSPARPFVLVGGGAYAADADRASRLGADAFAADAGEASRVLRHAFGGPTTGTPSPADAVDDGRAEGLLRRPGTRGGWSPAGS